MRKSRAIGRLWIAGAVAALLLATGLGSLFWRAHRRAAVPRVVAGGSAGPTDEREAGLLRAVRARPADARAHRELGAYYLESRRPCEALWELAVARELGERGAGLVLRMAEALEPAALPETAISLLADARRNHPEQPTLGVALARAELGVAEPEAALAALRRRPAPGGDQLSQSEPPASPEYLVVLAQAHLALGDRAAARAAARRCQGLVRTRPAGTPRADLDLYLGRLNLACGDLEEARKELAAAARDRPGDEETQYYAGLADAASDAPMERKAAIEHFQLAAQADPHQTRGAVALGRLLDENSGKWERAADVYRRALAINPSCVEAEEGLARVQAVLKQPAEAIYHRARVLQLKDRPDEAARLYRQWGELRPERWDSVLRAAECLLVMSRRRDAAREVRRGLERYPSNPDLLGALAQLYLRTDDGPAAAQLCERWAPLDRASGRPEWVRGQLAAKALRSDEAIRWFEVAVKKDPERGAFHGALGEALARTPTPERLRRARAELERATSLAPGVALFHSQLGQVLQQQGDFEGARQAFLQALDHDSSELEACRGVVRVARLLGRPGAASFFARIERGVRDCQRDERAAQRVLSLHPRDARARFAFARALIRRGKLPEARNQLQIAAEQPDGAEARPLLRRVDRLLSVL